MNLLKQARHTHTNHPSPPPSPPQLNPAVYVFLSSWHDNPVLPSAWMSLFLYPLLSPLFSLKIVPHLPIPTFLRCYLCGLASIVIAWNAYATVVVGPKPDLSDLSGQGLMGKKYLVTGGSAGIGMATVELLARLEATVVVLVRNTGKMEGAERKVWEKVENWRSKRGLKGRGNGKIIVVQCDLCSLASVRKAGSIVLKEHPDIQCLVLNAVVGSPSRLSFSLLTRCLRGWSSCTAGTLSTGTSSRPTLSRTGTAATSKSFTASTLG